MSSIEIRRLINLMEDASSIIELGVGWLNIKTQEWVPVNGDHHYSHASYVLLKPDKFGIDITDPSLPEEMRNFWLHPYWHDLQPRQLYQYDGSEEIISFMSSKGWVRIIHSHKETNIQGWNIREVRRAAGIIYTTYGGIENLRYDLKGNYRDDSGWIHGNEILPFIKGKSRRIVESFDPSDYGYWIMPNGEIISTSRMNHGEAAAYQLGIDISELDDESEEISDMVLDAIDAGGVRVVSSRGSKEISFEMPAIVSREVKASMIEIMDVYGRDRDFFLLQ